jgi:dihydroorotase
MAVDLVISNGTVCTPDGLERLGVAVQDGAIVAVAPEAVLPEARRTIDATGKVVMPGVIDAHVHSRDPGYTHKEDFESATRCAAFGGVTMIVDMPNVKPPPVSAETYAAKRADCQKKAIVDFNHWASPFRLQEIPALAALGAVGFKAFMKQTVYPYDTEASNADQGLLFDAFQAIGRTGLPCIVHPHNQTLYEYRVKKLKEAGVTDFATFRWMAAQPEMMESVYGTLLYFAERAGMRLGLLHCHTYREFEYVQEARRRGQTVNAEYNPWLIWPAHPDSPVYGKYTANLQTGFPLDRIDLIAEMSWKIITSDDFASYGYISTDHAPHLLREFLTDDPSKSSAGCGDTTSFYLSQFLGEVNRGRIDLPRVAKLCSENVARFIGVYPRKGCIRPGSDADFAIVDLKRKYKVTKDVIHSKSGWSIWQGAEMNGAPVYTLVRGKVVMENGKVVGNPGWGQFVPPVNRIG